MKYIITESQVKHLIDEFITNQIGGYLEKHNHESSMVYYVSWTDMNGNGIFESEDTDEGPGLGVNENLWNLVQTMFSLGGYETDKVFMDWMLKYEGEEFPGGVYTVEGE